jgi:hypothetical protein
MRDVLGPLARTAGLFMCSIALLGGISLFQVARAQSEVSVAGPAAVQYLPKPEALGEGWTMLPPQGVVDLAPDVFREGAAGHYGGPDGARAVVVVFLITDVRIAVRQAWEDASSEYDRYRYQLRSDRDRAELLATLPPPEGCEEVKRSEGADEQYGFATAITLCAGSADEIILAVVSGGDAATQGYKASDALAVQAIKANRAVDGPGALVS